MLMEFPNSTDQRTVKKPQKQQSRSRSRSRDHRDHSRQNEHRSSRSRHNNRSRSHSPYRPRFITIRRDDRDQRKEKRCHMCKKTGHLIAQCPEKHQQNSAAAEREISDNAGN